MYEFKLRIHISGWLILALLLVILLCHFVPAVSASGLEFLDYGNGLILPIIPEDASVYPYLVIQDGWFDSELYLFASSSELYVDSSHVSSSDSSLYLYDLTAVMYWSIDLDHLSQGWDYKGIYGTDSRTLLNAIRWVNFPLYDKVSGNVYMDPVIPQPVDPPSGPSSAVLPVFTVQPPLITWVEYNVGDSASPVPVAAVVDDGGTISYTWYRTIYAESGAPSNVVFSTGSTLVPDTSVVSDSSYYCVATNTNGQFFQSAYSRSYRVKVVESGAADPPSETPTYPSAEDIGSSVGDAFQGVLDQNDINTSEQGNSFVDQITQIVPNESQGFVNAMGGLVDSLSYGGTECVLTVPALVMPQIGDLVPQYTLLEKQEVDLESYFNMFPAFIVTLVQSLFTVALIVYCFKELYSTVSYFFVLRGGET